jgi:hypothetical protein
MPGSALELFWLPLGAGGHVVRTCGRIYEALSALSAGRPRRDLYHAALRVSLPEATYVIEQTPVPSGRAEGRGVVAGGAVGARWAGHLRIFRYEIRVWRDGRIPDIAEAVDSPRLLCSDESVVRRVLASVGDVPTPTWGRDELAAGEMWNSNAVVAWVLAASGLDAGAIHPPPGGRAPGWSAGVAVARRQPEAPSQRS